MDISIGSLLDGRVTPMRRYACAIVIDGGRILLGKRAVSVSIPLYDNWFPFPFFTLPGVLQSWSSTKKPKKFDLIVGRCSHSQTKYIVYREAIGVGSAARLPA
jgi:hypothetical protein